MSAFAAMMSGVWPLLFLSASFNLPGITNSPSVLLDWSASPGSDNSDDTYPGESGIKEYAIWRQLNGGGYSRIATVPYGTFTYLDTKWGQEFDQDDQVDYELVTVDHAGNTASYFDSTTIQYNVTPFARWNVTGNAFNETS